MSLSKFGAPVLGNNTDPLKINKLAQRVEAVLQTCLNSEPRQIDPRALLVAPANRDGSSPNVQHIHKGILASFIKNGFDRSRPAVGICVQVRSSEGKAALIEFNKRFSKGNELLPPIDEDLVMYGTLASSHLNIALRLLRHQSPSTADLQNQLVEGTSLNEVVQNGHRWWVLPESTSKKAQVEVSLWRNQDQNENQCLHELEILRGVISVCEDMSLVRSSGSLGEIISKVSSRTPAKIGGATIDGLARYYMMHLKEGTTYLAEELQDFHSAKVNPRELTVPVSLFEVLAKEKGFVSMPLVRHYIVLSSYTLDGKTRQQTGGPSASLMFETKVLQGLANKLDTLKLVETLLSEGRAKYLPLLERQLAPGTARLEFLTYADMLLRCLLAKPFRPEHHCKLPTGKFSQEKALELAKIWASKVDERYPAMDFGKDAGFVCEVLKEDGQEDLMVDLGKLKDNHKGDGRAPDQGPQDGLGFKSGDKIKVLHRFSWHIKLDGNPNFRRDIPEGASGVIVGYQDEKHESLLATFELKLPGNKQATPITQKVLPRNVVLESAYEDGKQGDEEGKEDAEEQETSKPLCPKGFLWLNEHLPQEEQTEVLLETDWEKLCDDESSLQRVAYMKGKVLVAMAALKEALPKFTSKDLVVCHRVKAKGPPSTEVWTARSFQAFELALSPVTTEIKEALWTKNSSSVFLGVPQAGPGRHPDGRMMALDGRGRSIMASEEVLDAQEHRGSLFFVIPRSSKKEDLILHRRFSYKLYAYCLIVFLLLYASCT